MGQNIWEIKSLSYSTIEAVRQALKRRYKGQLSMASWRGYTNLILDRTKYAGNGVEGIKRDKIILGMIDRANQVVFDSLFLAHETDMPQGVTF